jgi:hypothetical protein
MAKGRRFDNVSAVFVLPERGRAVPANPLCGPIVRCHVSAMEIAVVPQVEFLLLTWNGQRG